VLGIEAPRGIPVHRGEIADRIRAGKEAPDLLPETR